MKKILFATIAIMPLAACTPTEQGAAIGAASGGVIGAAVSGDAGGALAGAAIGGVAGALIGRASEGSHECRYHDRYGRTYIARCPRRY